MVPTEFIYWKSTFVDVLYLNGLSQIVSSDDIMPQKKIDETVNSGQIVIA